MRRAGDRERVGADTGRCPPARRRPGCDTLSAVPRRVVRPTAADTRTTASIHTWSIVRPRGRVRAATTPAHLHEISVGGAVNRHLSERRDRYGSIPHAYVCRTTDASSVNRGIPSVLASNYLWSWRLKPPGFSPETFGEEVCVHVSSSLHRRSDLVGTRRSREEEPPKRERRSRLGNQKNRYEGFAGSRNPLRTAATRSRSSRAAVWFIRRFRPMANCLRTFSPINKRNIQR